MDVNDVRATPEAIDGPWLTAALEAAGVARGATVTEVAFGGFIGTGQTGRNGRFALTWDQPEGRPASVVAKFPSDDPNASAAAFANGAYLREWTFYDQIQRTVSITTPTVWAARFDAEAQGFVLLMEDLSGSVQGDQIAGLTEDQAALAAAEAVGLHAPRWGEADLGAHIGIDLPVELVAQMYTAIYGSMVDGFLGRLGHRLDDDVVDLVRRFAGSIERWILGLDTPHTIVHMDYRPDNLLFGAAADAPPLVVVDWQTVAAGPAMNDLAYMIGGGFEPDVRAKVERSLLATYLERLRASGIAYDDDTCWRDYRVASLWGVAMTVIATMLAEETERGNDMLTAMAQRHGRHALDLDALSLL